MLLLMSALLLAADTPPAPQAKAPAETSKLRCERIEEIGSRLSGKKVCMTQEQWNQKRRDDRDNLDARVRGVHTEQGG